MSVNPVSSPPPPTPEPRPCPVARGLPLLGTLPSMMKDPLRTFSRIAYEHPEAIVAVPIGPMQVYLVTHPPHVEQVMHTGWRNFSKSSPMWRPLRRLVGNGLVASQGNPWVAARRTLQPLFNHKALAALGERMVASIAHSLDGLAEQGREGRPVEMLEEMGILTQNVILETVFDVEIARDEAMRLGAALTNVLRELNLRMFLAFLPDSFPLPGEQRLRRGLAEIDEGLLHLSKRWEDSSRERVSMLSLMRQAKDPDTGEKLSAQQVRDELVTMWVAGNETTATALTWVWYLLDKYPEVEARVRAEVQEVLGQRPPTVADLEHLRYSKRFFLEALRLYSPSWILPRQCEQEEVVGGYRIPAGATVIISQYITHHAPSVWDNPEAFDPDRFLPERAAGRHPYAYLPFGGGPRRCIGEHFALMESLFTLAMVLQRFRPRRADTRPLDVQSAALLRPSGPMMMRLDPV